MTMNFLFDVRIPTTLSEIAQVFHLLAKRPTGVFRNAANNLIIELRYFRASITRNGETTYYTRTVNGQTSILKRLNFAVVLTHLDESTITDFSATRFTKEAASATLQNSVTSVW